ILGVLPLAVSTGAGAGARHSVGTGVMGGMIAATLLAVFHVPLFFKVLYDRRIRETRSHDELLDEVRHLHHAAPIVLPPSELSPPVKRGEHD
ncbi:MAG TPA: hypothetical protein DHV85_10235, partial [Candidatus Accumulibacter sp.]|nr:hypothetical protein [Accumulibacter sp.]